MQALEVNGITINARVDGPPDGDPVLLSNSLSSALGMWDAQAEALVGAGYRVVRYDSRGHGGSDAPAGEYTLAQLGYDALGVLDALGVERAHFCGLSKGGMVGQWLGTHHGDRLITLTLCDTAAHVPPADMWEQRIAGAREGGMGALVDATIERWFTPAGRESLADDVTRIREMILATPVDGFCGCCAAIRDMDQRAAIGAIAVPTLVVVGEHDPSTTPDAARFIHSQIAGSELVILPQAAHLSNVEQAGPFNAALLGFLDAARGAAR